MSNVEFKCYNNQTEAVKHFIIVHTKSGYAVFIGITGAGVRAAQDYQI